MKHATLRQLKVFEAVARLLSFSRAAEELHLTQPAVSTQVSKLEEHAGIALFEQFGKKIYLTPAGAELLQISRAIIQQFEAAESAMTQFKGVSGGRLNVGRDQRRRLFLSAPAGRVREPARGVKLNFTVHNREGLLTHIADEPDRPRDHGAAAGRSRHRRPAVRAAPLRDRRGAPTIRWSA